MRVARPNAVALSKPVRAILRTGTGQAWANGQPEDWVMETHRVVQQAVYPFRDTREIDQRYLERTVPAIQEQLARAAGWMRTCSTTRSAEPRR